MESITVTTPLWRWQSATAPAAWYFLTIEGDAADAVRVAAMTGQWLDGRRGFGSARVEARIGDSIWKTSVFPHRESGGWLLPVKAAIRRAERLVEDEAVTVTVSL
ncbi:DUF1905 domain-containing protein [Sphingopyxis sp. GW247-27LB]|uniref:DUF1905 domain-containing protein n=1 Tax=Sphingopyxis sp. GW247-27LB TaxID=2012632 RepID=UPI000BA62C0B|nr:DUF1905 domain-containing protein [Sphingopyxis sp. GW247-27LB]PAL24550.1 hypothetical protein CD928_03910 [Sphingopyxis sp. GW247-27LB]